MRQNYHTLYKLIYNGITMHWSDACIGILYVSTVSMADAIESFYLHKFIEFGFFVTKRERDRDRGRPAKHIR